MPLQIISWVARFKPERGGLIFMPMDPQFKANDPRCDNHIRLSDIANKAIQWHLFVDFYALDPQSPDYPYFCEVYDNQDYAILSFNCRWSQRAGIQYGESGSLGSIPSGIGKHTVRFNILNQNRQLLASTGAEYFIDAG